jgi:hypothetical protein
MFAARNKTLSRFAEADVWHFPSPPVVANPDTCFKKGFSIAQASTVFLLQFSPAPKDRPAIAMARPLLVSKTWDGSANIVVRHLAARPIGSRAKSQA